MAGSAYEPLRNQQHVSGDESSANHRPRTRISAERAKRLRSAIGCDFLAGICTLLRAQLGPYLPSPKVFASYLAGALFAIGWWVFIDGVAFVSHNGPDVAPVPVRVEDWIPGAFATLALIVVNMINKDMLTGEADLYSDSSSFTTKARAIAFVAVSVALCCMGCSVAILVIKYIVPGYKTAGALYFGLCVAVQNFLFFTSSMVLWFGRYGGSSEGSISL